MPKLIIDGIEVEAEAGMTLLQACEPLSSSCPGSTRASSPLSPQLRGSAGGMDGRLEAGHDGTMRAEGH